MNKGQNLFSDVSSYYLTIGMTSGKRMDLKANEKFPLSTFQIATKVVSYEDQYSFNNIIGYQISNKVMMSLMKEERAYF